MIPRAALLFAICVFIEAPVRADDAPENTSENLAGVWVAEKVTSGGQDVPKDKFPFELHFTDQTLVFRFVGPAKGPDRIHDVTLDNTKSPATIDIVRRGDNKTPTVHGIYRLDGDRLLICSLRDENRQPSKERPSKFESSSDIRSDLLVLKRKPVVE